MGGGEGCLSRISWRERGISLLVDCLLMAREFMLRVRLSVEEAVRWRVAAKARGWSLSEAARRGLRLLFDDSSVATSVVPVATELLGSERPYSLSKFEEKLLPSTGAGVPARVQAARAVLADVEKRTGSVPAGEEGIIARPPAAPASGRAQLSGSPSADEPSKPGCVKHSTFKAKVDARRCWCGVGI